MGKILKIFKASEQKEKKRLFSLKYGEAWLR